MRKTFFISLLFISQFVFGQSGYTEISDTTSTRYKIAKIYENLFSNFEKGDYGKYIGNKLIFIGNRNEYKAVLFSPNFQTVSVKQLGITDGAEYGGSKPYQNIVSHIYHADVSKLPNNNRGSIVYRGYMEVTNSKDVIGKQFEVTDITFDASYVNKCLSKIPDDFLTKNLNAFYMPCDFQIDRTYMPYLILKEIKSSEIVFCNKPYLFSIINNTDPLKDIVINQLVINRGMPFYGIDINSGKSLQIGKDEKWKCDNINTDFQNKKISLILHNLTDENQNISIPIEEILKNSPSLILESDYIADKDKQQHLDLETLRLKEEIEREKTLVAKEQEKETLKTELENLKIKKETKIAEHEYEKKQKDAEVKSKQLQINKEIENKNDELLSIQSQKAQQRKHRQECINKYGEKLGILISSGQVSIGMTKEMCLTAKGFPFNKRINTSEYGTLETWNYYSSILKRINFILRFKNGKLIEINESK